MIERFFSNALFLSEELVVMILRVKYTLGSTCIAKSLTLVEVIGSGSLSDHT